MELKDRLQKSLFDHLDVILPDPVKRKLEAHDIRLLIGVTMRWIEEHVDEITKLPESNVVHRHTSSFGEVRDEKPEFLNDLKKV